MDRKGFSDGARCHLTRDRRIRCQSKHQTWSNFARARRNRRASRDIGRRKRAKPFLDDCEKSLIRSANEFPARDFLFAKIIEKLIIEPRERERFNEAHDVQITGNYLRIITQNRVIIESASSN